MKGKLIYNGTLNSNKFKSSLDEFMLVAKKKSIELSLVKNSEITIGTDYLSNINSLETFEHDDFIIFWDKDVLLARFLEYSGFKLFNNSNVIDICDDKSKTHLEMYKLKIPMPKTIFSPLCFFYNEKQTELFLLNVEKTLSYPLVIKNCYGSFGMQVYLINNRNELFEKVKSLGITPHIYQEFISESSVTDIRVQTVGNRILGAIKRVSKDDFRANLTLGGHIEKYTLSDIETKLIESILNAFPMDFAGIDLLISNDGPLLCEINSNAHFLNFKNFTDIDVCSEIFDHIERSVLKL